VAAHLGYCGLDARRAPLDGSERRPCWTASASPDVVPLDRRVVAPDLTPAESRLRTDVRSPIDFVSLDGGGKSDDRTNGSAPAGPPSAAVPAAATAVILDRPPEAGWSLFPELEA
jgi:hypothetical protein